MVEIKYQTAIEDCRKCYAVRSAFSSSPVTPLWEIDEQRRRAQIRTQADLEVLTNSANHAAMDVLKDRCTHCDFSRPRVLDILDSETVTTLEAADKRAGAVDKGYCM